ncbi:hypothetical protein DC498_21455 [Terrimonas sp.]|jgi:hypothetical protein|uniref:HYC_CC_PP family protein n=1 Tax=Terrimonas sp. TaxID=1914338 RepID=UPI000D51A231|nr:hypothetical protein [Terrimonas sp.]MBX3255626.1 hypothetical protein [Chitinophagaceae bacterium]PVD50182.1 hypothetical protein DC498_21455 [Terrimonas sp.]
MKKIFLFILAFTYFASTSGATLHLHYCMGKMVEWSVSDNEEENCPICGSDKGKMVEKGCCKDEHKQLKITNDHSITETAFQGLYLMAVALPDSFIDIPAITFSSITEENPTSNAPPYSTGTPIYKRNCVFRI